ncbi:hypothetical protein K435DRAFT_848998 [Dendrothele bispora CBS 962.96]|uniref:Uncharacterized protein n=1 Tax=Dendrothele bispora (strain CBS 962.96) TaxID=1314807 RepID=A0A4S8MU12_DENBC|nr:hypothetical protein K435DRAFT_848998 [Dendrothele bispora CBS 962.96]
MSILDELTWIYDVWIPLGPHIRNLTSQDMHDAHALYNVQATRSTDLDLLGGLTMFFHMDTSIPVAMAFLMNIFDLRETYQDNRR